MAPDETVIHQLSDRRDTDRDTGRAGGDILPGTPYHRALDGRTRGRGIWRGILAIVLLFGGLLGFGAVAAQISGQIDLLLGRNSIVTGGTEFTTVTLAATFASSALLIPWSMLIQRWLYGVRGRTMHSVTGVFRAAVLGRAVLVLVPLWALYMTVLTVLQPSAMTDWAVGDLLFMFVVTIVIVPLQSAGEEYGFRGLIFRVAASWGRSPRAALALGVVVSSVLFATIHLSTDLWLNLQFLAVGVTFALITWRTGGLETSVVLHAANNSLGLMLALALHADLNGTTDRTSGVGSMAILIPVVLLTMITAVIWYRTRHAGPALTPAPSHAE